MRQNWGEQRISLELFLRVSRGRTNVRVKRFDKQYDVTAQPGRPQLALHQAQAGGLSASLSLKKPSPFDYNRPTFFWEKLADFQEMHRKFSFFTFLWRTLYARTKYWEKKGSLALMDRCKGALCLLVGKVAMKYVTVLLWFGLSFSLNRLLQHEF